MDDKGATGRDPGISEAERRRRLHAAYSILLDAAREKATASGEKFGDETPDAASDASAEGPEARMEYIPDE